MPIFAPVASPELGGVGDEGGAVELPLNAVDEALVSNAIEEVPDVEVL